MIVLTLTLSRNDIETPNVVSYKALGFLNRQRTEGHLAVYGHEIIRQNQVDSNTVIC